MVASICSKMPDMLTTKQAAERLGVSRQRVQQMIQEGKLKATLKEIGMVRVYLISEGAVNRLRNGK